MFNDTERRRASSIRLAAIVFLIGLPNILVAADGIHWTFTGQTSVAIDWRGSENTVQYGTTPGNYTGSVSGQTPSPLPDSSSGPYREARITGLQQNTLYYYRIGNEPESTFRTPPPRGTSGFWFAEQADIGSCSEGSYDEVCPTQEQIASDNPNISGDDRPRFVVAVGDLTYGDQHGEAAVDGHFNDVMVWSRWAAYMPAWGNHEWDSGDKDDQANNYEGRFHFPNSQTSPGAESAIGNGPADDWYWYDYGNVRFVIYPEPYESETWDAWESMAGLIMAEAQNDASITFIVSYGHRPPYSSGNHGSNETIRDILNGLRSQYSKYVLNFAAHDHIYERADLSETGGLLQIVGAGGGATISDFNSAESFTAFRFHHLQHIKVHVTSDRIEGYVVCGPPGADANDSCTQGTIIDSWTITAEGAQPDNQNPTPPTALQANAPTSNRVDLGWNAGTDNVGVAGYNVFRTMTSGRCNPVGSAGCIQVGGTSANSYSDSGLSASTTYHYVVQSYDSAGNTSGGSTQAQATTGSTGTGQGGDHYVSTSGSDGNPGTLAAPWRTVNYAVSQLNAGETLLVRGGTYHEEVDVSVSGSSSNPIVIQGYPGEQAIIDSGLAQFQQAGNNAWELVNASTGEYRSTQSVSSGLYWGYIEVPGYPNARVSLIPYLSGGQLRSTSEEYDGSSTPFYIGPGIFDENSRMYIRLSKTSDFVAHETRYGQIFPTDNADPRNYKIFLSKATTTVSISGAYLTFRDLTFNHGKDTVFLDPGANNIRFENMTMWMGDHTIKTDSSSVHHITVTGSRLYGDDAPWVFWTDRKRAPAPADLLRGSAIDMRGGTHDWEISYNHIRGSGQDLVGVNNDETEIFVHHNRMENCGDDAFELEGTSDIGHIEIYENYIGNCLVAVAPGQDSGAMTGPLLVYRNVIVSLRNPAINREPGMVTWNGGGRFGYEYMFKHGGGSGYATRNTHYYHNTLVLLNSPGNGINPTPKYPDGSTVANNLMISVNGTVNGQFRTGSNQIVDGDLYWKINTTDSDDLVAGYATVAALNSSTGLEANGIGSVPDRGTNPQFQTSIVEILDQSDPDDWVLTAASEFKKPSDFLLGASSPARGAGVSLASRGLPDTRSSLDIGALPFGTTAASLDVWPFVSGAAPPSDTTPPAISSVTAIDSGTVSVVFSEPVRAAGATNPSNFAINQGVNVNGATLDGLRTVILQTSTLSANTTYTLTVSNIRDRAAEPNTIPPGTTATFQYGGAVGAFVDARIESGSDDVEQADDGTMYVISSDLELTEDGAIQQTIGMRFNSIQIPQGATITAAYIQFTVDEATTASTNLIIEGENSDNATPFGTVTSRARTQASVSWAPQPWSSLGAAGSDQRTPDLSSIVQSIVGRGGWSPGNSIVLIVSGSGTRTAVAYEGDPGGAPLLHIEFDDNPTGPPAPPSGLAVE